MYVLSRFGMIMAGLFLFAAPADAVPTHRGTYPTAALGDYIFACMSGTGTTRVMLQRCACSIDAIADALPYKAYVEAETILRMRQVSGEKALLFRETETVRKSLEAFYQAQIDAELRCF